MPFPVKQETCNPDGSQVSDQSRLDGQMRFSMISASTS